MVEIPAFFLVIYAFRLVLGYASERMRRYKIMQAFKKYVAPEVVDEIAVQKDYPITLGGEEREIAVFFAGEKQSGRSV